MGTFAGAWALGLAALAGCSDAPPADPPPPRPPGTVSFNKDIAPILFENCAACHRPGESAPFSLLTFDDAKKRARQIARVTLDRFMPPWLPEPGYGRFANQRTLSDDQIGLIGQWVAEGTAEGNPADLPPPPTFTAGWQLGEPDLVVGMPQPYTLRPEGADVFRTFVIRVPLQTTRYIKAVEFRPGNPKIVHHARLMIDPTHAARRRDEGDPVPGYSGMLLNEAREPEGQFLGWAPGKVPSAGSEDVAWPLNPGTDLVLLMHLLPSGKPETIAAAIGLFFADRPPAHNPFIIRLGPKTIDIRPGENDYMIEDRFVLPVEVQVLSVYPHAHYLGKQMKGWAMLPDGTQQWLLRIDDWDFLWQDDYQYEEPVWLPKGTTVSMQYNYDNSADNVRNPNQPPKRVVYGPQSSDEMGDLNLQVLPRNRDERAILKGYYARKELAKEIAGLEKALEINPNDAQVHNYLARRYAQTGRTEQAIYHFEQSLRLQPDFTSYAHMNLGVTLHSLGRLEEASGHFRKALEIKPDYVEAHYNLGIIFSSQKKWDQAVGSYRQALALNPDLFDAHYNLGIALAELGNRREAEEHLQRVLALKGDDEGARYYLAQLSTVGANPARAIEHLQAAVRLKPDYALAHQLLGILLARRGDFSGAIAHYRRALEHHPALLDAANNLAWILATHPDPALRDGPGAIALAERAAELSGHQDPSILDTLAAAYAEAGEFNRAVSTAQMAIKFASAAEKVALANQIRQRLVLYEQSMPFREPSPEPGEPQP